MNVNTLSDGKVESAKKKERKLGELSLIIKYLFRYKLYTYVSLFLLILSVFLAMSFPYFMGSLIGKSLVPSSVFKGGMDSINSVDVDHVSKNINKVSLIIIGILFIQAFFAFFRIRWFNMAAEKALADIRKDVYSSLLKMPMSFFGSNNTGEINNSFATDLNMIRDAVVNYFPQAIRQGLILILGVCSVFLISLKLALIMLSSIPPIILVAIVLGKLVKKHSTKAQDYLAKSNSVVSESMDSNKIVKVFGNEWYHLKLFKSELGSYLNYVCKEATMRSLLISFIIFALFGSITFVVWTGAGMLIDGELSSESFFRFVFFSIFVGGAVGSLPESVGFIFKTTGACANLMSLLSKKGEDINIIDSKNEKIASNLESDSKKLTLIENKVSGCKIEFKEVNFSYDKNTGDHQKNSKKQISVLSDVSFSIEKKDKVALVGASGAGKSTIVSLILRLYELGEGSILIDGKDIRKYDLKELRKLISMVPQDTNLFSGSIMDNIRYGNVHATDKEVLEASKLANAHNFILELKDGYKTDIGYKGTKLSGGQKQRIAIARSILADTPILILDEATSALDAENESAIQEAIDKLIQDRTCIMIAHRLSTIKKVDKIIVFKKGKIVEVGNHDELIAKESGYYKLLADLQFMETK